jgi:hypothetical protein
MVKHMASVGESFAVTSGGLVFTYVCLLAAFGEYKYHFSVCSCLSTSGPKRYIVFQRDPKAVLRGLRV